jgi:hypothetical protein
MDKIERRIHSELIAYRHTPMSAEVKTVARWIITQYLIENGFM